MQTASAMRRRRVARGLVSGAMNSSAHHDERLDRPLAGDETTLSALLEQQRAWETFAAEAIHMVPVLKAHMVAVTQETERATLELMVHLRVLASPNEAGASKDKTADLSKVVMAMQFQDITRQKLEHVGQALEQLTSHLRALLKGSQNEEAKREIAALERIEHHYTMEEERRLHRMASNHDYGEPVPMGLSDEGEDSVTLF